MSIYGTRLSLSDEEHEDGCAIYVEIEPGVFDFSGKPCDCGIPRAPIVYEGSHVLPAYDDRRGGGIDVAEIPDHIDREGREPPYDFLRLSVYNVPSQELYEGKPYISGGDAAVVLDRPLVKELRDALTAWLDRDLDPEDEWDSSTAISRTPERKTHGR